MRKKIFGLTLGSSPFALSLLCVLLIALSISAEAQQPAKIPRIGYAASGGDINNPGFIVEAFRRGLRDLGYIEGKNIVVEYRYPGVGRERNYYGW